MPFRSKRHAVVDGKGTPNSTSSSISFKRRKTLYSSGHSDNSTSSRNVRSKWSRLNRVSDGSITISSESDSPNSSPGHRNHHPSEPVINKEMNSHSQTNANNQSRESKSSSDDLTIVIYSDSSPSKELVGKYEEMESAIKRSSIRDEIVECDSPDFSKCQSSHAVKLDNEITGSKESGDSDATNDSNETFDGIDKPKRKSKVRKIISSSSSDSESSKSGKNSAFVIEDNEEEAKGAVKRATGSDDIPAPSSSRMKRKTRSFENDDDAYNKTGNGRPSDSGTPDVVQGKRVKSIKHRLRHWHKRPYSSSGTDSDTEGKIISSGRSSPIMDDAVTRKGRKSEKEVETNSEKDALPEAEEVVEEAEDADDVDGKKGRRKIRKILKDKRLSSETKNAEALERERRKRLEERQKLYNSIYEDNSEGSASKSSRLVLDFKKDSEEALVEVHPDLVRHLKPHQVQAVRFLYDNIIESVDEHKENRSRLSGAILAHCMGLGKTLSTIAFVHTLMTQKEADLGINTCLILCPVNTLLNWVREWRHWMPGDSEVNVFEVATAIANTFRADVIRRWHTEGGVLLMGYDMYRNLTTSLLKRTRKPSFKKLIPAALIDPGPDIVVCDEGHLLKNCKTGVTKAINGLKTPKRIILTGTPLQNNLSEYWTMVNFVKPNLLGSAREFANRFVNPIKNGQHSNSTQRDVQLMKKRAHILFKTLDGCVQRKDYSCLTKYLPPRLEYVLKIRLSDVQCQLYRAFLQWRADRGLTSTAEEQKNPLFHDQQALYRVWTHPYILKMHETREARRAFLEESSSEEEVEEDEDDKDEDGEEEASSSGAESDSSESDKIETVSSNSDSGTPDAPAESSRSTRARLRQLRRNSVVLEISGSSEELPNHSSPHVGPDEANGIVDKVGENDILKPWWRPLYRNEYDLRIDVGAKLSALFFIIKKCAEIGDKVLIFSQSLFSLDLIEWFLAAIDRQWCMSQGLEIDRNSKQSQELDRLFDTESFEMPSLVHYFSDMGRNTWRRGQDYERIDGSLSAVQRNVLQTRFNGPGQRFRLLIISTKAGGLGVNLTAANRLIIFDVSWNPSHDVQSIFRSYRFGQTKPVYIYRMVAQGTMEEKIYDRQVTKQSLALRVIDEQQVERHFKEEDLRELYTFEPDIWDPESAEKRPPPTLPKDRLLADLLSEQPHLVASYHNHDSLLENRLDEGLSEAERAEAWREYEEEKRVGRPMTEYQRLLLNDPEAAMLQRQRIEEEQRRMMSMAYNAAGNRLPYASINPSPLSIIDSMYTTLPASSLNYAPRPVQQHRDILSESYNEVQNVLLSRYPMLARSPSALHDMTMRLFLNSMANSMAAQNTLVNAQIATQSRQQQQQQQQQSILSSLMANSLLSPTISSSTRASPPTNSFSQPAFSNIAGGSGSTGGGNNNRTVSPLVVDVDNESSNEDV
ncbi:hypothetical protein Aperf_G00000036473 [Anoplocephala perfoliata]